MKHLWRFANRSPVFIPVNSRTNEEGPKTYTLTFQCARCGMHTNTWATLDPHAGWLSAKTLMNPDEYALYWNAIPCDLAWRVLDGDYSFFGTSVS